MGEVVLQLQHKTVNMDKSLPAFSSDARILDDIP